MKNKKDYSIIIGGAAGQGSRKAGLIIAKLFNNLGYNVFISEDYQSLIKGGHNFSVVRISEGQHFSNREKADFLLALDANTINRHEKSLEKNGCIIFNKDKIKKEKGVGIASDTITKELGGLPIMSNTALIAGFSKAMGIEWKVLEDALKKELGKGIEKNLEIAKKAYEETKTVLNIEKLKANPDPLLTGNEAIALGAVKAGLDIYYAYPMTPATSILHYLAEHEKDFNIITAQLENEIAVINSAVGSAFAGKRSMVGTSGGGFALMTEGISLAAMAETPVLIISSQRSGPATGVPTYGSQADLLFTLNSGHGDFVRFIAAPGDANESCYWSGKLLNLAWKYQTPAILLVDKELSESTFEFDEKILKEIKKEKPVLWSGKGEYKRYTDLKSGISPMAFPGDKAIVKGTSYEHDEKGLSVEDSETIMLMQEKRLRKFEEMRAEVDLLEAVKVYGNKKSKKAIVAWGSTKGVSLEIAEKLGLKFIQPLVLQPFPKKQFEKALKGVSKLILVECSASGQMEKLFNCNGVKVDKKILKYDMRPFTVEELERKLKNI
ncbi:MAG TPA: 2-oxoacid:acceptor oxidoreductase subunit alpha [Candidatus Pacearchaeota archaeon]|nr:2-oxoacid:acceptor oxidoreductase subunit alpha [Candidatus Pacearchaeota archaeon]HPR79872.1 2-oxoacid:acceptor oxidoreductase subunit alpha [Candidatus Pacearchaeota archaeon]